jgi:CubicO group peptidase (beta-lactamase class C family)
MFGRPHRVADTGLIALLALAIAGLVRADEMVFPKTDWEQVAPESEGVDSARLAQAVEYLQSHTGRDGARELLMVRNGRVIWQGDNAHKVHNVWSCTKSFTSTVLGLLIDDGRCSLDTRAAEFVAELKAHYPGVALRHFATMTSGYRAIGDDGGGHGQSPTPFDPQPIPLFQPGAKFAYWDSAQNQFAHVLARIAGEPIAELFRRRIADPIGMAPEGWRWGDFGEHGGLLVNGGAGNKSQGIFISAREMARFGHLMLNEGRWNSEQLLSRDWVVQATSTRVPASLPASSGAYGFNWWCNGQDADGQLRWPDAPAGTFAAEGHNNNRCFVIPEWRMVIVRLGLDAGDHRTTNQEWSEFLGLVGKARVALEP